MRNRISRNRVDPFTDLIFNILLGFVLLFFISILFINPITKLGNVNLKAEYIITIDWPDNLPDDIDLWVRDPNGEIVSYLNKDAGWLHLDRDDRGVINDRVKIGDQELVYPLNREIVTLRGLIPGEYIVNVFLYEHESKKPVNVKLTIEKVNPSLKLVYFNSISLPSKDAEITIARFSLNQKGNYSILPNRLSILTPYQLESY